MKKVLLIFSVTLLSLIAGYSLSIIFSDNNNNQKSEEYCIVRYSRSFKDQVSDIYLDKGNQLGFNLFSTAADPNDSIRIMTEADILNSMGKMGYRLSGPGILSDRKSPYTYAVFEK